ncbi:SpoIIE family protein phosphatase [Actinomadura sp. NAK00032]|nr:SpoIIE family protein phosphatase [Actinomadura sp. NAK00032]
MTGHGIDAAASMGRLRTAMLTLAHLDLPPGELLTRLDELYAREAEEDNSETESPMAATCLYVGPVRHTGTYLEADWAYCAFWRDVVQHWSTSRHLWDVRHADELRDAAAGARPGPRSSTATARPARRRSCPPPIPAAPRRRRSPNGSRCCTSAVKWRRRPRPPASIWTPRRSRSSPTTR